MKALHARRGLLAITTIGGVLASALAALPAHAVTSAGTTTSANTRASAGATARAVRQQVAPAPVTPGPAVPLPAARQAMLLALARESWLRGQPGSQAGPAGPAGAALAAASLRAGGLAAEQRRTGALTGVVRGPGGRAVTGACVTATGPSGSTTSRSRADGRYIMSGLPPGEYALRVSHCAGAAGGTGGVAAVTALWPGLPAQVTLGTGQVKSLPPVTVLPSAGLAARVQPADAAVSQAGTGGISGRVTRHGHSLLGVCVLAYRVGGGSGRGAETSKSGRYHITGLQPGRYLVQFAGDPFCHNPGNWLSQWYPGITSLFPSPKAAAIRVRAGKTRTGVDASLKQGGQIGGTVRTRSGRPLPGVCVEIEGRVAGGFVGYGFESGRGGRYALHGLFPGRYTLAFSIGCGNKGNYAPQWWRLKSSAAHATPIRITGTRVARHIDAALDRGAAISGTVRAVNSSGKPLARICVHTASRHGDSADAITGKDGTYRLTGLAGGRYVVEFDPSCFGQSSRNYLEQHRQVSVKRGQSRTSFNAYLQPGAGVSGVVTGPHGHPLEGVCVQIASRHANGFAESDVDGSYSITGLPAGSYTVQFTGGCGSSGSVAPQYYKDEPGAGSADPLTLTAGTITTGIDAAMKPGAAITGVVTDPAGHRLTGVCVGVADQSDVLFGSDFFTDIEFTSGGRYRAVNLAPGLYQVEFGCGGGKYASHWFRVKAVTFSPDLISVPAGVTSGVSAVIRLGGAISGVVTDKAGHRVSFACVLVVDARTGAQVPSSIDQGFADNGRYKIAGLAPGRYKVQFYGCGRNYASQWYHGRSTERAADQVRVRPGHDTTGISAALAPGGSISGLVVARATGKPVRRVCVEAFDAATQGFGFAETGRTGAYTMRGLSTGHYSVSFALCYAKGPNLVALTRSALVPVTAPHAVTGINARLAPGGSISGTVLGGSPTNRPQIDTCVIVVPVSPVGSVGGFAVTRTDGTYTATGLPAGKYQVLFNISGCEFGVAQFASQWYNGQPTEATADAVTVSIGATTSGIDATLQLFGGITGTVTGPGHTPVPGECVTAVAAGKDFAGTLPPEFAISSKTGSYSLVTLQPGTYKVKFTTGCGDSGFAKQWWQDAGSAPAPTVITVGAGATTTGIDAALTH